MEWFPAVVQAVPGENFTVYTYWNDGAVRLVDVQPLIAKGGVFSALADPVFFRERLTVLNDTVAWDVSGGLDGTNCIDLDPCNLFHTAKLVNDPLLDGA